MPDMDSLAIFTGIILLLTYIFYGVLIGLFTSGWYRKKGSVTEETCKTSH